MTDSRLQLASLTYSAGSPLPNGLLPVAAVPYSALDSVPAFLRPVEISYFLPTDTIPANLRQVAAIPYAQGVALPGQLLPVADFGSSPLAIPNLALWLAADRITGLADGAAVTTWSDQSGNGNDATQATSTKRPLYKTGIVNGLPVVRFDGVDDFFALSLTNPASDYTVFAVANSVINGSDLGGRYLFDTATGRLICALSAGGSTGRFDRSGFFDGVWHDYGAANTNTPAVHTYVLAAADPNLYRNGATLAAGATDTYTQKAIGGTVALGSQNAGGGSHLSGDMAEFLLYTRALSDAERHGVERYLERKYGLPVV